MAVTRSARIGWLTAGAGMLLLIAATRLAPVSLNADRAIAAAPRPAANQAARVQAEVVALAVRAVNGEAEPARLIRSRMRAARRRCTTAPPATAR